MITIEGLEPTYSLFPNNEYNMTLSRYLIDKVEQAVTPKVIWRFDSTDEVFKLGMLLSSLEMTDIENVEIHLGYLPYSRMDRHDPDNVNPFSLEVFINMLPAFKNGKTTYVLNSVHNEEVTEKLLNDVFHDKPYQMNFVINKPLELKPFDTTTQQDENDIVIVLPDKGSIKRYEKYIDFDKSFATIKSTGVKFNYLYGGKVRNFDTHEITGYELYDSHGNVFDGMVTDEFSEINTAFIIDDISSYGGTFIKIIDILNEKGIDKTVLLVGNIEDSVFKGELLGHKSLECVLTFDGLTHHTTNGKVLIKDFMSI